MDNPRHLRAVSGDALGEDGKHILRYLSYSLDEFLEDHVTPRLLCLAGYYACWDKGLNAVVIYDLGDDECDI